jgi:hypothetical protein
LGALKSNQEQMNRTASTTIKAVGWLCRVVAVYAFFAVLFGVFMAGQAPMTLVMPFALYGLGSWLIEGNKVFKFKWK